MAEITDDTMLKIQAFCDAMGFSRTTFYRYQGEGYVLEFPRIKMTTRGHFKEWARSASVVQKQADLERLQHEQRRLHEPARRRGVCDGRVSGAQS